MEANVFLPQSVLHPDSLRSLECPISYLRALSAHPGAPTLHSSQGGLPPTFSHTAPTSPAHCPRSLWKLPPLYKLRGFYRGDHNTTRNKNVWNHKHDLCSPWVSKGMNSDTCFITHSRERNSPWVAQALGPRKRSWFLFQCPSLPTPSHLFLELQVGPEPSGHQQRMGKALLFTGKNEDFSPAQLHYTAYHRDGTEIPT